MEKQFTYKPEVLVEMAQEYLQAEEAFRVFIKKHTPFPGYCNLTDRNDESEYWRLDKETSCTWDALRSACRMVDADITAVVSMATPAPFIVAPSDKRSKATISPYYSESGDFVAGFNSDYAAIIDPSLPRKGKNAVSPMVIYSGDEPQAMILPVRLDETTTTSLQRRLRS